MFAPAALLTIATVTAPLSPNVVVQQPSQRALQMGVARSDTLAPRDTARWTVALTSGEYAELEVRQRGVDVVVRVIGPDGSARPDVDSPTGAEGIEHARWIAHAEGDWTVIVPATRLLDVARHLRTAGFDFCSDLTASDWPQRPSQLPPVPWRRRPPGPAWWSRPADLRLRAIRWASRSATASASCCAPATR